ELQGGGMGQFDGRGQRFFEWLGGGPICCDKRRRVKLERQAVRLRHVGLGSLDVTERVVRGPFGSLRQGKRLGEAIRAEGHAAFWREVGPEPRNRRIDV